MLSIRPKLYKFWIKLLGDPSKFPLHARIFHSVTLISIVGLAYNIPFNYLIGLPYIAVASLVVLVIGSVLYYLSRFKNQVRASIFILNFVGLGLFSINYFLNSGIHGPTDLFFLLFLILTIAINPVNQYKVWIPVNILIVSALHVLEYLRPDLVPNTYSDRLSLFADETSAYVVIALISFFCIDYILQSYESEKKSALEKSKAIEQKNLQILRQNEELEKINSEKNKLMSIVAHDLRSPLASIQNYLELLTEFELEEEQKLEIKKQLLSSTKDTLSMLSKLLAWSKSQSHGTAAFLQNLDLNLLLESTLHTEKTIAAHKGIVLDYYFEPSTAVYADRDMMQLIMRNFIGNAIKFTPTGGSITVRAAMDADDCIISIKDTGIGISPERQDALFSLNAKSTYGTKGEKGMGLGLLLCVEYIAAQNGRIWFESTIECGTCFFIAVPLREKESVVRL
ncbi:sensor histidine kinase [Dyadobacter psychrotolerans]|uniref:histidine kinase n=1 Tax=Dyadobacter psychrotolerans TaxID=2541721 RepID=A0A4R5DP52_9BACT|nr:HAMP domain-containing sensor histidine kinase [Dyadobacter psychrotolerans]TDE15347.1 HAMP domain-containing histidine kinase [Dyadobacter psychrotolerans]